MRTLFRNVKNLIPERHPLRLLWHQGKAFCAALLYGFPARRLTVIGITGTDGKTTTVGMVHHILQKAGRSVGSASTAFLQIRKERKANDTHLTSLSPFVLQRFLRRLVREGCEYAVVEASSHGLVQGRNKYMFPSVAAITNTSLEHLDYHATMERYRADKGKLFHMLRGKGTKILNAADESYALYEGIPSDETIAYGKEGSDLWIADVQSRSSSVSAKLHTDLGGVSNLTIPVPGIFNLENAQCAIACAMALGIPLELCIKALETFEAFPGRLERINAAQNFHVFVDFAVSPQAYEKTLTTLRGIVGDQKRVLVLCSSCGNRMREKRPEVGRIASELADVVVVTEDETYGEDPEKVLEEVWAGVDQKKAEAHKIFDRRRAIRFLLKEAQLGDAVVLCGMGPFTTFTKLEGRVPWDEREIVKEILLEMAY